MSASRVEQVERMTGLHRLEKEKGAAQGELRRQLSTVNLRSGKGTLLSRLLQCGERQECCRRSCTSGGGEDGQGQGGTVAGSPKGPPYPTEKGPYVEGKQ